MPGPKTGAASTLAVVGAGFAEGAVSSTTTPLATATPPTTKLAVDACANVSASLCASAPAGLSLLERERAHARADPDPGDAQAHHGHARDPLRRSTTGPRRSGAAAASHLALRRLGHQPRHGHRRGPADRRDRDR